MNKLLSALLALGWIASGFTQTVDSSIGVDSPPADLPASPTTLVGGALSGNGTGGPPAWAVSKRSQNSRVWTRASQTVDASGKAVLQTNGSYTELATGLHFKDALGNWTDSLELVEIDDSPAGGAKALVEKTCGSGCHSLEVVTSQRMNEREWSAIVQSMVARGAQASNAEQKAIVDYLVKTLGR